MTLSLLLIFVQEKVSRQDAKNAKNNKGLEPQMDADEHRYYGEHDIVYIAA
jgi:hypothetical protein